MANSIESRLPFMDMRLVELALALPDAVKIRHGFGKWIVRQVVAGMVPDAIRLARYKRGFDVEHATWIDGGLGRRVRQALLERDRTVRKWLRPGERIEVAFSDRALKRRPTAFAEATTLLWLADVADPTGLPREADASAREVVRARIATARDDVIGTIP
jgi:asparagine synthase (glutamine-hydrolysing)